MDASKDIQTVDYPLSNPHSDVRSRFFYNILLYYKRKIITSVLQSRETVWWFLLKCQIQGLFPLRDPQVNLQYFVFQPGKDWPGLWALAPHCFFLFVCLDWLIQVTTCYFFVQVLWLDFFSPLMVQISYLPAVSLWWKLCAGREPLVAELGWWTWPWL